MSLRVCIEEGCWAPATGPRCTEHEREHQRLRELQPKRRAYRKASYRGLTLVGQQCWCCGTAEDLTRHHVNPLALGDALRTPGVEPYAIVPLCRSCNSSIGAKIMGGFVCPQHGGIER